MKKENSDRLKEELNSSKYNSIVDLELLNKLVLEAQNGNQKSRDLVVNSFLRLVYDIATKEYKKQSVKFVPFDDFFQAGTLGLMKSFKTFKLGKAPFINHACTYITKGSGTKGEGIMAMLQTDRLDVRVNHMVKKSKNEYTKEKSAIFINRIGNSSDDEGNETRASYSWLESGSIQPDKAMERSEAKFTADEIMRRANLTDLERDAFFGANKGVSETIEDLYHVAEIYSISHEGARKASIRAYDKMKEVRGELI